MIEAAIETRDKPGPQDGAVRADISFIVATYNAAPFVGDAIRSALAQTGVCIEVIVADDASTDGTADLVEAMAREDARIMLIRRAANGGPSAARNAAMERAGGDWLAILDGDDLIAPERSRRLLDLAAATSADIVADNFRRFHRDGETGGATMIPPGAEPYAFIVDAPAFLRANRAFGSPRFTLGAVKGMFRTEFLKANGIRHREGLDFGEDFLFCLNGLLAGARFVVTSESFYRYRMHAASQSWRLKASHLAQLHQMIGDERLAERFGTRSDIALAAQSYVRSFERAAEFVAAVDAAKARDLRAVLQLVATNPAIWPLILRFGGAAIGKRLRRLVPV
ncbi:MULTISPECIES: glycosyltransferase [Rhodomicrobium]|uniref:glycosyltransferase family 2 protein n=1 Tax=Rhodomicrobium TaxID=1068 RepID=UPI000B4BD095|nr:MULTISPECIES: glycosyltransferase [Rhodomicrobium]